MSFASLKRIVRSAKKGLCSTCSKSKHPQLEAAGAGHVGCLMHTVDKTGLIVRDEFNASALHMAARKGQIDILIYLIQNKIATEVYRAANGATPAHDAAGTGKLECLRYLIIQSSCSPHDRDMNGSTPLHWAAQFGHLQVAAWLVLEGNAQLDAITKTGVTPVHLAASRGHINILRWLVNHAYKKHANPMRLVNGRARNGATPIYFASQEGHIDIVKWLAEKAGGDPMIYSDAGMAPLHAAAQEGHLGCVQFLFRFGLNTSAGGLRSRQDGASALHYAACQGHEDIVSWLLSQKDCTGSEKDFIGSTPVHDAADEGRVRILQVFYNHGVNLAVENSQGDTPLDLAHRRAMKVCVQFLEMALKRKLPRSPAIITQETTSDDQLLISEVADFYSTSPSSRGGTSGKWQTFRDLMESEDLLDEDIDDEEEPFTENNDMEEEKRARLREEMRREEDMKKRMRMEKLKDQRAMEEQIRENLLAEEGSIVESLADSGYHSIPTHTENRRPLSMPSLLPSSTLEKDAKPPAAENNDVKKNSKRFLNRFLRKSTNSDSRLQNNNLDNEPTTPKHDNWSMKEASPQETAGGIPSPPPIPKMEYLLSTLPRSKQIQINNLMNAELSLGQSPPEGNDSDTASVGSSQSKSSAGSSGKKKRKEESRSSPALKRHHKPGSSPPLPRRARVRKLTPIVKIDGMKQPAAPSPKRLLYDEQLPIGQSPSPTVSPFSSGASSRNITPGSSFRSEYSQRIRPQNQSDSPYDFMKALNTAIENTPSQPGFMRQNGVTKSENDDGSVSPTLLEIEHQLQAMQQMVHGDMHPQSKHYTSPVKEDNDVEDEEEDDDYLSDDDDSSTETSSEEEMDEFVQLNLIKPHLQTGATNIHSPKRKLSPIPISGGVINRGRLVQKRVYRPRLFSRRRLSRLDTIVEETEEKFHTGTPEERAAAFWGLRLQQKLLKGWRSYVDYMKVAYQNADVMYQQTRRELMSRVFYGWIQARNYGVMDKMNSDKAVNTSRTTALIKAFTTPIPAVGTKTQWSLEASLSTSKTVPSFVKLQTTPPKAPSHANISLNATPSPKLLQSSRSEPRLNKEEEYLAWLNKYLKPIGEHADDLEDPISIAVHVLLALGQASGGKVPRYHKCPILPLQRMSNWKLVTDFMKQLGINARGIEPEDLTNNNTACLHNMFANIIKWDAKRESN